MVYVGDKLYVLNVINFIFQAGAAVSSESYDCIHLRCDASEIQWMIVGPTSEEKHSPFQKSREICDT